MYTKNRIAHFSPGRIILCAMFVTIFLGTLLLSLPMAQKTTMSLLDILFTTTSALCVTGLATVPLDNFTTFGSCVLLALIQIGGLGVMTLSLFIMSLFVELGFTAQLMAGKLLDLHTWKDVSNILLFIISITLIIEIAGALCIFPFLYHHFPLHQALFISLFHSVSSFCNAGISILNHHTTNTLLFSHSLIIIITGFLIFCGSLGFIAWIELCNYYSAIKKHKRYSFSLFSKIIFRANALLITAGTLVFWLLERNHGFASMNFAQSLLHALFTSITMRSCGFLTMPLAAFTQSSVAIMLLLAFIGASPVSTGSGVKITSIVILIFTIRSAIARTNSVNIKGRQIPIDLVFKALAIVILSIMCICVITFFMLMTENNHHAWNVIVESYSSFTNLGISYDITQNKTCIEKIILIFSMIIGRIGSLTFMLALKKSSLQTPTIDHIHYPKERVMLS